MKDEIIKNIIYRLDCKSPTAYDGIELSKEESNLLLDYITNLQEENEILKDTLKLRTEIGSYMKRKIDNAIEYCNLYTRLSAKDLLNILQGGDK